MTDTFGALHVNLQDDVVSRSALSIDLRSAGPIKMAINIGPLQKLATSDHRAEGRLVNEEIFMAVLFRAAWRAGRIGNRIADVGYRFQNAINQGAFAAARG